MLKVLRLLRRLYAILEERGYRPVIIGTYALILQGWLPEDYLEETKDTDIYIPSTELFIEITPGGELYSRLLGKGFNVILHETGGITITHQDLPQLVELIHPLGEIFVPNTLLTETVAIEGLTVLEAHAVIVAKALGEEQALLKLADKLKTRHITLDRTRVEKLAEKVAQELVEANEPWRANALKRRVKAFLERYLQK